MFNKKGENMIRSERKPHLSFSFCPAWNKTGYRLCQSVSFFRLHDTVALDWNPQTPLFKSNIAGKHTTEFPKLHFVDTQSNMNV